jgi:hypothetical protein
MGPALVAPAVGLVLAALVLVGFMALAPDQAYAADPVKTGYVVVRFGQYDSVVHPFTFTTAISSYRALQLAGLDPAGATSAWGLLLCGIQGQGQPTNAGDDCDNGTYFWATSYWSGTQWEAYMVGVDQPVITQDGHIDGFSWVDWTLPLPSPEPPHGPGAVAAHKGLEYLRPLQSETTGGYGTANDNVEATFAVAANRYDLRAWRRNANAPSLFAALIGAGRLANLHAGGAGKYATGLAAGDGCWPATARSIASYYDPATGKFDNNPMWQAWAIIGTRALSQPVLNAAVNALKAMQNDNGGWPWSAGGSSDTNATAVAIQALLTAGESPTSTVVADGLNYLDSAQNSSDGGFPYDPVSPFGTDSDSNSTAYVLQAILAAGEDPTAGRWKKGSNTPISFLLNRQLVSGAFEWQAGTGANPLATMQAVVALMGRPFPYTAATPGDCPATFLPVTAKQ